MLAFGISAIGKVGAAYTAKVKTLDEYYEHLNAQALPVLRGLELDADDRLRRDGREIRNPLHRILRAGPRGAGAARGRRPRRGDLRGHQGDAAGAPPGA